MSILNVRVQTYINLYMWTLKDVKFERSSTNRCNFHLLKYSIPTSKLQNKQISCVRVQKEANFHVQHAIFFFFFYVYALIDK